MSTIFETMVTFFEQDEWPYSQIDTESALRLIFQGSSGKWICYAQARETQQQFVFYSVCHATVPEEKRLIMSEFFSRANYGLIIGNFEMDFSDGEIRYKTSIDVENDRLTPALIKNLVYANVVTMDHYLPGIMAVIYASVSPSQAIAQIEGGE